MGAVFFLCLTLLVHVQYCNANNYRGDDHYYDHACSDVSGCRCYTGGKDEYVAECDYPPMDAVPNNLAFNITALSISGTRLHTVKVDDLEPYAYLVAIILSYNEISHIDPSLLASLPDLEIFTVQGNQLSSLDTKLFANTRKLTTFDASFNDLHQVPDLSGLANLVEVGLEFNMLEALPNNYFSGCRKIERLNLNHNRLAYLDVDFFQDMKLLTKLYLEDNKLPRLENNSFTGLNALESAHLSGNSITFLGANLFPDSGPTLRNLYFDNNQLAEISTDAFDRITYVDFVDMEGNQFTTVPTELSGITMLTNLDLSRNLFTTIPPRSFESFSDLHRLYLKSMDTLETLSTEAFHGLYSLEWLILSNNTHLVEFTPEHLSPIENPSLTDLLLNNCSFVHLSEETFSQLDALSYLDLYGNKLNCNCDLKWMPRVHHDGIEWARHWDYSSATPPTCHTPTHMHNYDTYISIPNMREGDMVCDDKPVIESFSWTIQIYPGADVYINADVFTGLPASTWIVNEEEFVPYPVDSEPPGLRVFATWRVENYDIAKTIITTVLHIHNVSTRDTGFFTLIATNAAGNTTGQFELAVNDGSRSVRLFASCGLLVSNVLVAYLASFVLLGASFVE